MSFKAMKVSHKATKSIRYEDEAYDHYVNSYGDRRLLARLINGRKVKPCGKECREYGYLIAGGFDHASFENFHELMNDEEFLLDLANVTQNPRECKNYFYQYINPYISKHSEFRLKFLKAVYLNENVYKLEDISWVVETFGLEKENEIILNDMSFKRKMEQRLEEVAYQDMLEYNCSGQDKKELHEYKVKANDAKILCENIKIGLKAICNSFAGEKIEELDEPKDYYEFICRQQMMKNQTKNL